MQFYNDNKAAILMYLDNNKIIKNLFLGQTIVHCVDIKLCSRRTVARPRNSKILISHRSIEFGIFAGFPKQKHKSNFFWINTMTHWLTTLFTLSKSSATRKVYKKFTKRFIQFSDEVHSVGVLFTQNFASF